MLVLWYRLHAVQTLVCFLLESGLQVQNLKVSSTAIAKTKDVLTNNPEREDLLIAIKKAKSKISTAEYRIKKGIGTQATSEQNRTEGEQELQQLEKRLSTLKNGYQLKM